MITLGIDPGARYTGVVLRDEDQVLLASTYVRPVDMPPVTWARRVTRLIRRDVLESNPDVPIGIEGIADPKGFKHGAKDAINPRDIIRTGIIVGTLAENLSGTHRVVIIPPKKNGSGVNYPAVLSDRRPADLPGTSAGAGTRQHEKSAYDVAGEVLFQMQDGYILDMRREL